MSQLFTVIAALLGALYVGLSAYVSHQSTLSDVALSSIGHAQVMHIVHVLVVLVLGVGYRSAMSKLIMAVQGLFIAGIGLFSLTIYAKYLLAIALWGKLTMYGGMLLILAWLALGAAILYHTRTNASNASIAN